MNSEDQRCSESKKLKSKNQVRAKYASVSAPLASIERKSRCVRAVRQRSRLFQRRSGLKPQAKSRQSARASKASQLGIVVALVPAYGASRYGLYGESSLAPARSLIRIPDGVSFEQAAATWAAYGTAWAGLVALGKLAAGQTVLLPAASSSVGLAAIQIANRLGTRPIALTRTAVKANELRALGAAAVVATEEQDLLSE